MTEKRPTGGPAFPVAGAWGLDSSGMTLRDYFAAAALGALIQTEAERELREYDDSLELHDEPNCETSSLGNPTFNNEWLCQTAYSVADQMIRQRELRTVTI
jgi:hypothetical protein